MMTTRIRRRPGMTSGPERMAGRWCHRGVSRDRTGHHGEGADDHQARGAAERGGRGRHTDQRTGEQRTAEEEAFLADRIQRIGPFFQGRSVGEQSPVGPHRRSQRRCEQSCRSHEYEVARRTRNDKQSGGTADGEGREYPALAEAVDEPRLVRHRQRREPEDRDRGTRRGERVGGLLDGEKQRQREQTVRQPAEQRRHERAQRQRQQQHITVAPGTNCAGQENTPGDRRRPTGRRTTNSASTAQTPRRSDP